MQVWFYLLIFAEIHFPKQAEKGYDVSQEMETLSY